MKTKKLKDWQFGDAAQLNYLQQLFSSLRRFLRTNRLGRLFNSQKRPWIILLGGPQSGKTTLLANSQLQLQSPTQQSLAEDLPTQLVDWWINEDAIFIDLAGKYALPERDDIQSISLCQYFFQLSKRFRKQQPADHALLIIDMVSFGQANALAIEKIAYNFTQQIHRLKQFSKVIPLTLILTQCDQLLGFSEYFSDLSPEEQAQPLGFTLSFVPDQPFSQQLKQQLKTFITRINERLIWNLQHERNISKRGKIQVLPMQIEKLCQRLTLLIPQLPNDADTPLQGAYLTSAQQQTSHINLLRRNTLIISEEPAPQQQRTLFITDTLKQAIEIATNNKPNKNLKFWLRLTACGVGLLTILIFSSTLYVNYKNNAASLRAINSGLKIPNTANLSPSIAWLPKLTALSTTITELQQHHQKKYRWQKDQTQALLLQAQAAYLKLLNSDFQNYLVNELTQQINSGLSGKPMVLYSALKTYLTISTPSRFNKSIIDAWFKVLWQAQYPNKKTMPQRFEKHLQTYLSQTFQHWPTDIKLIATAQHHLQTIGLEKLILSEITNSHTQDKVSIVGIKAHIPGVDLSKATVSKIYSSALFDTIYNQDIPNIAQSLTQHDWVLGIKKTNLSTVISHAKSTYLQAYAEQWTQAAGQIQLKKPTTLAQVDNAIDLLTSKQSPLLKLFQLIIGNTILNQQGVQQNNIDLSAVNAIANYLSGSTAIRADLQTLQKQINKINHSDTPLASSFQFTSQRFQQKKRDDAISTLIAIAKNTPQPIQHWLNTIAYSSWDILLQNSHTYISKIWQAMVVAPYNQVVRGRYPIFATAKSEMSLSEFADFFGPNGTIGSFFNEYLKPYVNIQKNYWVWNTIDKKNIGLKQTALDMLLRASIIQQMFFTDNPNSPSSSLTLTPLSMTPDIRMVSLNLEGQTMQIAPHQYTSSTLIWPGPLPGNVRLTITTNKAYTMHTTGPWAWFRLLDKAKITTTKNIKQFKLIFSFGKAAATFQIKTDNKISPYIPGVIAEFRCPNQL